MTIRRNPNRRPFDAPPELWERNSGAPRVLAANIHRPDGPPVPGVHIKQPSSNSWFVIPEEHALKLADTIIDVIESRQAKEAE